MSDQVQSQPEPTTECTICGLVPGPSASCTTCHGNQSFIGPRQFTLTEERQRRATQASGTILDEGVGPRIVALPGSANPNQGS